ncbi:MAG: hypothetical protein AAF208_11855 [Cyanobacteria bacterium P01_A01_bin.45]
MKELTAARVREGILEEQVTITGGIRNYGTRTRQLSDGIRVSTHPEVYQFSIDTGFPKDAKLKGALTVTKAGEEIVALPAKTECFVHDVEYCGDRVLVSVKIVASNARITAVNIEGRIVNETDGATPL